MPASITTMTYSMAMRQALPPSPPSAEAPASLERELAPRYFCCSQCERPITHEPPESLQDPALASIRWLPDLYLLPTASSVIRLQPKVLSEGAGNHPCVVALVSDCGHLLFCMPVTSFNGDGIVAKYAGAKDPQRLYEQYMPLAEQDTVSTHSRGMLAYKGDKLKSQSYVHLNHGYWIEREHLTTRYNSRVTDRALQTVKQAYAAAEIDRRENGDREEQRLTKQRSRSCSPPSPASLPRASRTPSPNGAVGASTGSWRCGLLSPPPSPTKVSPSSSKLEQIRSCNWWRA